MRTKSKKTLRKNTLVGRHRGALTVIRSIPHTDKCVVRCAVCGKTKTVFKTNVRYRSRSCGCQRITNITRAATTHGGSYSREYRVFQGIHQRCENPVFSTETPLAGNHEGKLMAQASGIVSGVPLHLLVVPPCNSSIRAGVSDLDSCTPQLRESFCQNSAPSVPPDPKLSEAKKLFFEFLTVYFGGIEVFGVQAGFGPHKDTYLAKGPYNTTMCIETDIILKSSREEILETIAQKVEAKRRLFEKPNPVNSANF